MTYKSISDLLQILEDGGKIARYEPKIRKPSERRLYLSARADKERSDPYSAVNTLIGRGFIEAALTRWTAGDRIYADESGKPRFLKELDPPPHDLWELRVTEPVVQARLIGAFAEKDTLVLLAFRTRNFLGKKGSSAWNEVLAACDAVWREIFGLHPRMRANAIGDYVSSNYDPFKLNR